VSRLEFQTSCICGEPLKATVRKPTLIEPKISKFSCQNCESRFLIQVYIDKGVSPRVYKHDIEILDLSEKAKALAKDNAEKRIGA